MDFDRICTIFTLQEPYYGILLSAMDRTPTMMIPTMGVCRSGNVFKLLYNPHFIADKDLETMMAYLKHEVLHIAFNHFSIWNDEPKNMVEHDLRNIACDLEVNSYIDFTKADPSGLEFPKKYGWQDRLGTMEYYKRILKMNEEAKKKQQQKQSKPKKEKEKVKFSKVQSAVYKMRKEGKSFEEIAAALKTTPDKAKEILRSVRQTFKSKSLIKP